MSASVSPYRRGLPLAVGVFACSLSGAAMAQDAPGWLNWGGSTSEEAEATDEQPAARTMPADPTSASTMPVANAGEANQSGQAVLLQRLMQRVDALERQMQSVRGQLSEQERQLQRQSEEMKESIKAARSQPPATTGGSMSSAGAQPSSGAPSAPDRPSAPQAPSAAAGSDASTASGDAAAAPGAAAATDEEQQALYNDAFAVLKSGDYDAAIAAFQKVIDANPQGSWTPSAFFWKGETYYVKQEYDAARDAYAALVERFPQSRRIPDAKLKMGYIAQEQGDKATARQLFNEVMADHPDSQAAGLAKQRLSRMGGG